jgi:hypothetical protein
LLDTKDFEELSKIGDDGMVDPICRCGPKKPLEIVSETIMPDRTNPGTSLREAVVQSFVVDEAITNVVILGQSKESFEATMGTECYPIGLLALCFKSHPDASNTT